MGRSNDQDRCRFVFDRRFRCVKQTGHVGSHSINYVRNQVAWEVVKMKNTIKGNEEKNSRRSKRAASKDKSLKAGRGKGVKYLKWRVNTPNLFQEILTNNGMSIFVRPLQITASILAEVATRAAELNDPQLNALMCRLALYDCADPYSKGYNQRLTERTIRIGTRA